MQQCFGYVVLVWCLYGLWKMGVVGKVWNYVLVYVWYYVVEVCEIYFVWLYYVVYGLFDCVDYVYQMCLFGFVEIGEFGYVCGLDDLVEVWIFVFVGGKYDVQCIVLLEYFVVVFMVKYVFYCCFYVDGCWYVVLVFVYFWFGWVFVMFVLDQYVFDFVMVCVCDIIGYLVFVEYLMCDFDYDVVGFEVCVFVVV